MPCLCSHHVLTPTCHNWSLHSFAYCVSSFNRLQSEHVPGTVQHMYKKLALVNEHTQSGIQPPVFRLFVHIMLTDVVECVFYLTTVQVCVYLNYLTLTIYVHWRQREGDKGRYIASRLSNILMNSNDTIITTYHILVTNVQLCVYSFPCVLTCMHTRAESAKSCPSSSCCCCQWT